MYRKLDKLLDPVTPHSTVLTQEELTGLLHIPGEGDKPQALKTTSTKGEAKRPGITGNISSGNGSAGTTPSGTARESTTQNTGQSSRDSTNPKAVTRDQKEVLKDLQPSDILAYSRLSEEELAMLDELSDEERRVLSNISKKEAIKEYERFQRREDIDEFTPAVKRGEVRKSHKNQYLYNRMHDPEEIETEKIGDEEIKIHVPKEDDGGTDVYAGRYPQLKIESNADNPESDIHLGINTKRTRHGLTDYGIPRSQLRRHLAVFGMTGSGKSTLIDNYLIQLAYGGDGFCFIDPKPLRTGKDLYMALTRRLTAFS